MIGQRDQHRHPQTTVFEQGRRRRRRWRRQQVRDRRRRLEAFATYAGANAVELPSCGWRYHTRYPLGDEPAILQRLGLRPEDCRRADVYWHTGDDLVFLEVELGATALLEARWSDAVPPRLYPRATVVAPAVTHAVIEAVMVELVRRCPRLRLDQRWRSKPR
jgi:hypothetical protein